MIEPDHLKMARALQSGERRCGVHSLDASTGCCRPERHDGDHCAHPGADLSGTPSVVGVGGGSVSYCDGTKHPAGDHVEPAALGAAERERFVLDRSEVQP